VYVGLLQQKKAVSCTLMKVIHHLLFVNYIDVFCFKCTNMFKEQEHQNQ